MKQGDGKGFLDLVDLAPSTSLRLLLLSTLPDIIHCFRMTLQEFILIYSFAIVEAGDVAEEAEAPHVQQEVTANILDIPRRCRSHLLFPSFGLIIALLFLWRCIRDSLPRPPGRGEEHRVRIILVIHCYTLHFEHLLLQWLVLPMEYRRRTSLEPLRL